MKCIWEYDIVKDRWDTKCGHVINSMTWENSESLLCPFCKKTVCELGDNLKDRQCAGDHYDMPIQPIEFILANDIGYCEGNIIKYICRYKRKGGIEDLEKAKHYIDFLIDNFDRGE